MSYIVLGSICYTLRQYEKAISYFKSSLEIMQALSHKELEHTTYTNLATVYQALGRLKKPLSVTTELSRSAQHCAIRRQKKHVAASLVVFMKLFVNTKNISATERKLWRSVKPWVISQLKESRTSSLVPHITQPVNMRNQSSAEKKQLRSVNKMV